MKKVHSSLTYLPQEEMLDIKEKEGELLIGIPKEEADQEDRIPLTPQAVDLLVSNGHEVIIQHNSGIGAYFSNNDYAEAGAQIAMDKKAVFKSEIIIKAGAIQEEEVELMRSGQTILSPLQLPNLKGRLLEKMMRKRITALSFEHLKDASDSYPIVHSMSEIAGSASMLIAGQYLSG